MDYLCTTILEYADRFEGKILHRGNQAECESVRDSAPDTLVDIDPPIRADIVVTPAEKFENFGAGQPWLYRKPGAV